MLLQLQRPRSGIITAEQVAVNLDSAAASASDALSDAELQELEVDTSDAPAADVAHAKQNRRDSKSRHTSAP
jgi:hypothetical protein